MQEYCRFISQFEDATLPREQFNHIGHLKLAWLYLSFYEYSEAVAKVTTGIEKYATRLGAKEKFNCTLTVAIVNIIADRYRKNPDNDFHCFLSQNPDLQTKMLDIVTKYYSAERLHSKQAKKQFICPDKQQLPYCTPMMTDEL
ncbi:MAG: hypothetical protein ACFHVJ_07605 [Aestuariibacter sp.]